MEALGQVSRELVGDCLEAGPEELTLDVDATIIAAEKQEAEWTYAKVKGYQPLLGYVDGACVHQEFRAGNEPAGAGAVEFLKGCEAQLPAGKKVYVRSDSAFYQAAVMNHCGERQETLTITADQDCAAKAAIRQIVVRWKNAQPSRFEAQDYSYHAVASNREESESASEVLWRHNQRGEAENWHKELKLGLGMEQMPCGQQEANAVYFAIGALAYNLSLGLKAKLLPRKSTGRPGGHAALETVSSGGQAGAAPATPRTPQCFNRGFWVLQRRLLRPVELWCPTAVEQ